jgi:hypothetical protein
MTKTAVIYQITYEYNIGFDGREGRKFVEIEARGRTQFEGLKNSIELFKTHAREQKYDPHQLTILKTQFTGIKLPPKLWAAEKKGQE